MTRRQQITAAIHAEFNRRLVEGQAAVDARRLDRDAVNRTLAKWWDMMCWANGHTPVGRIDFSGWADAARVAARKCAARLERAAGVSHPLPAPAAQPVSVSWDPHSIEHARALRTASIELHALAVVNRVLRADPHNAQAA